jgi:hypothetical protein
MRCPQRAIIAARVAVAMAAALAGNILSSGEAAGPRLPRGLLMLVRSTLRGAPVLPSAFPNLCGLHKRGPLWLLYAGFD